MKQSVWALFMAASLIACTTKTNKTDETGTTTSGEGMSTKDTLTYPYKATYSSDVTVPSHPEIAQKVLTVWKLYETNQIDSMKAYYADTVVYENAQGFYYRGVPDYLLSFLKKEMLTLDSLRFDISRWESVHMNDRNEDWVNIWAMERHYPKRGVPDSGLMQESWRVKDGKVIYFNEYRAKLPK